MDIYLTDLETNDEIQFPMLPQEINIQAGTIFQNYTVMTIGDIKLPIGEELTGFSWNGILPGEARKGAPFVREWRNPKEIQGMWSIYHAEKKKLRLLITETLVNHDVYLDSHTISYKHGYGDVYYNIRFVQAKDLTIKISTDSAVSASTAPQRPEPPRAKTHTVSSKDTLWGIAQKNYGKGAEYIKIYNANKDLIEAEAKKRGRTNSENGHWIWPGTVLTIP